MIPAVAIFSLLIALQPSDRPAPAADASAVAASGLTDLPTAEAASRFAPGAHMRLLEASAAPDIEKRTPTAVVASSSAQLKDPLFREMRAVLESELAAKGFNIVPIGGRFINAVVVGYRLSRDVFGEQPGQGTDDPNTILYSGAARLPSHRRITVTSYDLGDRQHPRLLWRTAVEEEGFDVSRERTLPPLARVAARYYAENVTAVGVADCGASSSTGSHIPTRPCAAVRASLEQPFIVRQPKVVVEPDSSQH